MEKNIDYTIIFGGKNGILAKRKKFLLLEIKR